MEPLLPIKNLHFKSVSLLHLLNIHIFNHNNNMIESKNMITNITRFFPKYVRGLDLKKQNMNCLSESADLIQIKQR